MTPEDIKPGHFYSNGAYGRAWGVRMILEQSMDAETGEDTVAFKGTAGVCRRKQGFCSLGEFASWAKYEVALNENSWQRVGS